jgi:hypothetical protein
VSSARRGDGTLTAAREVAKLVSAATKYDSALAFYRLPMRERRGV